MKNISWLLVLAACCWSLTAGGAPYGDPNQPYDKLPGTLETYHVKWATPLADGRLKVLFIIPYKNSREVVELRQRLDLDYTVIMVAGKSSWWQGYREGAEASPIENGEEIVNRLARERLALDRQYDAIVIGKISWEIIPTEFKDLILQHVQRGTALVYVSPNRTTSKPGDPPEATTEDAQYTALFHRNHEPYITSRLTDSLPFDVIPLVPVPSGKRYLDFELSGRLPPPPRATQDQTAGSMPGQQMVSIRVSGQGKGKVVVLDYWDKGGRPGSDNSLTPEIYYDPVMYDYAYALLARCVRFAAGRESEVKAGIFFNHVPEVPPVPLEDQPLPKRWGTGQPATVFERDDLPNVRMILSVQGGAKKECPVILNFQIRNRRGEILHSDSLKTTFSPGRPNTVEKPLPFLERGDYFVDLRVLDAKGAVLDSASQSFRVESVYKVAKIETDKDRYERGETIRGKTYFSQSLPADTKAEARVTDTWGRVVAKRPVDFSSDRRSGTFAIEVVCPLARLWDIAVVIQDARGEVDRAVTWVGLPDWTFDEYLVPLIFCAGPGNGTWKGETYTGQIRKYGINAANASLIYGSTEQYEAYERAHLISLSFAEHHGQLGHARDLHSKYDKEFSESCMAQRGQMARQVAATGQPLDPKKFTQTYNQWEHDANYINRRIGEYQETLKFGSPYYLFSGEEYLSGEFDGRENSCFCPLCEKNFQEWCRKIYAGNLAALNAEWGSDFKSWEQVRGILMAEAAGKNQLPRWVAFRHFMRSFVWDQFFIDWTDMIRRILGREVRTGTNGHDQYDFSRFRKHMTSGKVYALGGSGGHRANSEYLESVGEELRESFSGDNSFLLAPESMMTLSYDQQTPLNSHRWPWKVLFAGYRGFDWEASSASSVSLGGMSCFTPDYSEPMPFLKNIGEQVLNLQRGIGKLCNTSKPERGPVAILWSPVNHYISRLFIQKDGKLFVPREGDSYIVPPPGFTGSWLYNISVDGGVIGDALVMMKNLRIRSTFVAPEDLENGGLEKRGFKALILPYNKGMSVEEAEAIRAFVKKGGLVIGTGEPGSYSRFGRKLERSSLADLFPVTDRDNVLPVGKGFAAYLPTAINGYLKRMEKGDYSGADAVANLLEKHAGIRPSIELIDETGKPRRDTLMPVYVKGSGRYVGMLRASTSEGKTKEATTAQLGRKYHVWNVREGKYLGFVDRFDFKLDLYPKFFALLPANPAGITVKPDKDQTRGGDTLQLAMEVAFADGDEKQISQLGQVMHVEVLGPDGRELEWYRDNVLFEGRKVLKTLPISYSEKPGKYTVKVEYPLTGMKAETSFVVR